MVHGGRLEVARLGPGACSTELSVIRVTGAELMVGGWRAGRTAVEDLGPEGCIEGRVRPRKIPRLGPGRVGERALCLHQMRRPQAPRRPQQRPPVQRRNRSLASCHCLAPLGLAVPVAPAPWMGEPFVGPVMAPSPAAAWRTC